MNHPLQCRCGTLKGEIADPLSANRVVCYCRDCQAFAHFLGRAGDVLDDRGGSDILQILPRNLVFTQGLAALACMRLTPQGLVRWYAGCCNTPIGNTLATRKISFIGLVHSCVATTGRPLDEIFGPVRGRVHTNSATGDPKPGTTGMGAAVLWFLSRVLKARINGDYRRTPFFNPATGELVRAPTVLSAGEREAVMIAVRTASGGHVRD